MTNTYQCPKLTVDKTFNVINADSGCGCAKILDGGFKLNSSGCKVSNGYKIETCSSTSSIFIITLRDGTVKTIENNADDFSAFYTNFDYSYTSNTYFLDSNVVTADIIKINFKQIKPTVTNISYLFSNIRGMTEFMCEADLSNVTNMLFTWYYCMHLQSFPQIDTSNVTNMNSAWCYCYFLPSFPQIDTSNVTNMHSTWLGCPSLTSFPQIDTSNVTNMNSTWAGCPSLTSFPQIDTSNVTDMNDTWNDCESLTSFPQIDTSNVTNMNSTWLGCWHITSFGGVSDCSASDNTTWLDCDNLDPKPCGQ